MIDHWGFPDGLPQVSVTSIAHDRMGYLWMSTQGGLARFDGLRFTSYGASDLNGYQPSITDRVWRDDQGDLWLGTPHGAALLDQAGLHPVEGLGANVGQVHGFAMAPGGSVLIGTDRGVFGYSKGHATRLGLADSKVYALLSVGSRIYAGSDGAVYEVSGGMAAAVPADRNLGQLRFTHLASRAGRMYVGSSRGLFEFVDGKLRQPAWAAPLAEASIEALHADRDGNLWIGLIDGLMRYNAERGLEWALTEHDSVRAWIASIFEDPQGDLWIGSYTTGLSRWWNGWAARIGPQRGLSDPFVWSVARGPDQRVWLGTATGVWQLDAQDQAVEVISTQSLRNSAVYNLFFPSTGGAWIGTRAGMARWNGTTLDEPALWSPLSGLQINAVLEINPSTYWIGTSDGLYLQSNGLFKRYGSNEGLSVAAVRSLVQFEEQLYVGTEQGLYAGLEGQFKHIRTGSGLDAALVTALLPMAGGKLVIGTFNDGIYIRDLTGYSTLGGAQGLPWNSVANLQADSSYLWVSSPRGVYRLSVAQIENFLLNGGRVSPEPVLNEGRNARGGQRLRCCNAGATSRGLYWRGKLWFPSLNGLVRVDPEDVEAPQQPDRVMVERIIAEGGQQWPGSASMELPRGLRDITIEYTALAFRDPESVRFRYRMVGYESDWQSLTDQRSVRYTNLAPGHYQFELSAQGGATDRFVKASPTRIVVPAWPSETLWFRLLAGVLALASLAGLTYLLRIRSLSREQRLQRVVDQRTEELRRANERLRNANQALAQESFTDGLTGLKNRRFLAKFLADWRRRSLLGETDQERLWLFLMDLDHFKAINDRLGHLVGDDILKQFSQLMLRLAGDQGHAFRWGGEEFLLLVPESAVGSPERFAERVVKAVRRADFRANEVERVAMSVSMGVCPYPAMADRSDIADWAMAMELADVALYWVKTHGRDGWNRLLPASHARHSDFSAGVGHGVEQIIGGGLANWQRSSDQPG
ncbi:MAG: diguanylate cyclase [Xanthomonadales bacterium]|nr:diguanylate cyclase [Xanthomonadales bacterium]